jgi:hypothetical protein
LYLGYICQPLGIEAHDRLQRHAQGRRLAPGLLEKGLAGDGAVGEGVGLGHSEGDEGDDGGQQQTQDGPLQVDAAQFRVQITPSASRHLPALAPRQPDHGGHAGHGCQRGHVDARGHGQAQEKPEQRPPAFLLAGFGGAHGCVHGHRGQGGRPVVHGEEVRLLDGHHGKREQEGAQETGPPAIQAPADEKDEEDGEEIDEAREKTPQEVNAVVGREVIGTQGFKVLADTVDPFGHDARDRHGEVAVDVKGYVVLVVGVERRFRRTQIGEGIGNRLQPAGHARQETLVRVQVVVTVPIEARKAKDGAQGQNGKQRQDDNAFPAEHGRQYGP